jgi:D-alanyl-D-alanine carboxypeptidase
MTSGSISTQAAIAPVSDAPAQSLGLEAPVTQVAEADAAQPMPAALPPQGWIVQIGASPTQDGANGLLDNASGKVKSLKKLQSFVERFEKDGQTYFRARFSGFAGQDAANDMCKQLKQAKMSCLAMQS